MEFPLSSLYSLFEPPAQLSAAGYLIGRSCLNQGYAHFEQQETLLMELSLKPANLCNSAGIDLLYHQMLLIMQWIPTLLNATELPHFQMLPPSWLCGLGTIPS